MKYLLDTHVLLWYLSKDPNLSAKAKGIVDGRADLYFSIVSLWEIAIKVNIGKLQINRPIDALPIELQYIHTQLLPITTRDIEIYSEPIPLAAEVYAPWLRQFRHAQVMPPSMPIRTLRNSQ